MSENLSANSITFIALTNEYCQLLEQPMYEKLEFLRRVQQLLTRIYVVVSDIPTDETMLGFQTATRQLLQENQYDAVRRQVNALVAEDDVYLEVFMEDMKYSDTPVSTSISENLADLYQEFYNFIGSIEDIEVAAQQLIIAECQEHFMAYWGTTLCNVIRAIHHILYADHLEY